MTLTFKPDFPVTLRALLLGVLAAGGGASAGPQESMPDLMEMPEPVLERMAEAVRNQLRDRRSEVDRLLVDPARHRSELVKAFGGLGRLYLTYGLSEDAALCWQNAELLEPESFRWPYLQGFVHQRRGRLDEAAAAFRRAAELTERDARPYAPVYLRLAQVELERRDVEPARALFRKVLGVERLRAAALYGLGQIAAEAGDFAQAAERFEEALAEQPEALAIHHPLGIAYRQLGDLEKARAHLRQAGDTPVRFADPVALSGAPDATGAGYHHAEGTDAAARGDLPAAVEHFRKALALDPALSETRLSLAQSLARLGAAGAAREEFEEAVRRAPDNALLRYHFGSFLARSSAGAGAVIGQLREAIRLAPEYRDALLALGLMLTRVGRFEEAAGVLENLLEKDPDDAAARRRRAEALAGAGRADEALAELERLADGSAKDAHFNLAMLLGQAGDLEGAAEHLGRVLEIDPRDRPARYQRALALAELSRFEAAAAELEPLLVEPGPPPPEASEALNALTSVLARKGDAAFALERLRGLLERLRDPALRRRVEQVIAEIGEAESP